MKRTSVQAIAAAVDVALIRNSPGGRGLSNETAQLLALLVFDDYLLFPSRAELSAIDGDSVVEMPTGKRNSPDRDRIQRRAADSRNECKG